MGRYSGFLVASLMATAAACGPGRMNGFDDTGPSDVVVATDAADRTQPPRDVVGDTGVCAAQADCDDHLACTMDLCVVGGVCQHMSTCPNGQYCTAGGCSATMSCTVDGDCDDHVMCTRDICAAGGACQHLRDDSMCDVTTMQTCSVVLGCIAMGRCGADADCDDGRFCNGAEHCALTGGSGTCQAGTAPSCDDMDSCTADTCSESMPHCVHTPLNPCGGQVVSGTFALSPPPTFSCADGTIGPVSTVMLMVTASGVTVTGFPNTTLTGGAPSMGMFSATGPWNDSGCGGTITLSGSFTMPGYFMGTWSLSAGTCDISCNSHFARTNGTLQH